MNVILEEILRTEVVATESGGRLRVRSHIPREEGIFLQEIVANLRPEVSLEVGLAYGVSALFICEELAKQPAARHIVIDPHQFRVSDPHKDHDVYAGAGLYNLKKAGYERIVEFHDGSSEIVLPQLASQRVSVDFAFIDGWHTFDSTLVDFFYVDRLLRPGGIVVLDDTDFPSVWKACRFLVTNRAYKVVRALPIPERRRRNFVKMYGLHYSRVASRM